MLAAYVYTQVVRAEPRESDDGRPGHQVYFPAGYSQWIDEEMFAAMFRRLSKPEREILDMTDAEASIAQISDGEPRECPNAHDGRHHWQERLDAGDWKCDHCPATAFDKPAGV